MQNEIDEINEIIKQLNIIRDAKWKMEGAQKRVENYIKNKFDDDRRLRVGFIDTLPGDEIDSGYGIEIMGENYPTNLIIRCEKKNLIKIANFINEKFKMEECIMINYTTEGELRIRLSQDW